MQQQRQRARPVPGAGGAVAAARPRQGEGDGGVRRQGEGDERLEVRESRDRARREQHQGGARRVLPRGLVGGEHPPGELLVPVPVQDVHLAPDPADAEGVVGQQPQHAAAGEQPHGGQRQQPRPGRPAEAQPDPPQPRGRRARGGRCARGVRGFSGGSRGRGVGGVRRAPPRPRRRGRGVLVISAHFSGLCHAVPRFAGVGVRALGCARSVAGGVGEARGAGRPAGGGRGAGAVGLADGRGRPAGPAGPGTR